MRMTFGVLPILLCFCCCCLLSVSNSASGAGSSNKAGATSTNEKDGAAMVWVPEGSFTMGSALSGDDASAGPSSNGQGETKKVTLSGFWIYTNEVTVAEYRAFCAATGHALPVYPSVFFPCDGCCWSHFNDWTAPELQQMPIVDVTWADAVAYATWAGMQLPTEAQYEYAVRGPQENNYPWGGTATVAGKYIDGWDNTKCANSDNSIKLGTRPVGSFPQGNSWCGASDLAGNVWEWCADWYGNYSSTHVTNPTGPKTGTYRVLRGGSWYYDYHGGGVDDFRGAYRDYNKPDKRYPYIGFRCVALVPGT